MKSIDNFLDKVTMYRLVLWHLIILVTAAVILSLFKIIPFEPIGIIYSVFILCGVSWITNKIFSILLKIPPNIESVYITSLILCLIITPPAAGEHASSLPLLVIASASAMTSKYLLNIWGKHIFNPAAFGVVFTTYIILKGPSWWVSLPVLLPLVIIGGLLIVRKLRAYKLFISFVFSSLVVVILLNFNGENILSSLYTTLIYSQILFFGSIMLTEPLTMPTTQNKRIFYGAFVGVLFNPMIHLGSFYLSPELALLCGNVLTFVINPKKRYSLVLDEIKTLAEGMKEFTFKVDKKLNYKPGQYMEWTLNVKNSDARGNRRYFTLASSPTEINPKLGVRFYSEPSTFKKTLASLNVGDKIFAGQISGEFTLPKNKTDKLAFLAGGIGVTPFRSMIKNLIDKKENRDIVMIYSNRLPAEIAYEDIFKLGAEVGVKTVYTLSETAELPENWTGERGFIDETMIKNNIPDFKERTFYISGSHNMVSAFKDMLKKMGVSNSQIKTDFFPGLV